MAGSSGGRPYRRPTVSASAGANELMDGQNHSKLFRDTIFGRFLIHFNPAPGAFVIMRRVDVLEQRIPRRTARSPPVPSYAGPQVVEQSGDLQVTALDPRAAAAAAHRVA